MVAERSRSTLSNRLINLNVLNYWLNRSLSGVEMNITQR